MRSRHAPALGALLLFGAACAGSPLVNTAEPYRSDPVLARSLAGYAARLCAAQRGEDDLPPHPFTTDGCSAWPDASWKHCCVEHDVRYWCGGSAEDRERADDALRACVTRASGGFLGGAMEAGVRIGGAPWAPAPWRWGYGWDYYRAYDAGGDAPAPPDTRASDDETEADASAPPSPSDPAE
jgi:hypothetical protein